jgi:hypothetical protein
MEKELIMSTSITTDAKITFFLMPGCFSLYQVVLAYGREEKQHIKRRGRFVNIF